MGVLRRLVNVLRPDRLQRDIDDELEFHREMGARKALDRGLSAEEARQETDRRIGNPAIVKEQMRDARVIGWLASSLQDLRHGFVLMRREAGVSALILLVLALGIGGNAAIFTLVKAAFLDPLPYRESGRLITIMEPNGFLPSTYDFVELRTRTRTLEQMAFAQHVDMQLNGTDEPARILAARVTASFFPVLGVNAALGRTFEDEENGPGRAPAVVLTDGFWRGRMGADPSVIGHTLRLDGRSATVVGVLPEGFHFDYPTLGIAEPVDVYVPYPLDPVISPHSSINGLGTPVRVISRMREGATLAQVETDVRNIAHVLSYGHPEAFPNPQNDPSLFYFTALPLRDAIVGTQRSLLWLLFGGVGVLLLIACANTAQLLLARSLRRAREVAIRSALGASRLRLIRQFLLEGFVLAACGGMAGLIAAGWISHAIVHLLPSRSPLLASAHLDMRVIAFTLGLSMISALVFAILPAMKGSRWTPGPSLTARVTTVEGNRWRNAMIAIEAALSVFLLCAAGLVTQNLWTLMSTPMGFEPNHVLAMRLTLPSRKQNLPDPTAGLIFQEYLEKVQAIPGVESAATVTGPPLRATRGGCPNTLIGLTDSAGVPKSICALQHQMSSDYFRTLGVPLLAGRTFGRGDVGNKITVAIVNEEFARRFGRGADIVGKQIDDPDGPITIVGLVGNVRASGLRTAPTPEKYFSLMQLSQPNVYLVVRSALSPGQLLKQVKMAIGSSNSDQSVFGVITMDEMVSDSATEPRFDVFLAGVFSLLAVAMAAAGMYSVISYLVSQRSNELAIRMALGAAGTDIVRSVLGTTATWVAAGLICGLGLALATSNVIRSLSNVVAQGSPWMYAWVVLFFFLVTIVSAYVPMRRVSRLDPAVALRCE
jgi:putative ABC transport system permease protein